jgi:hypothetical protein
MKEVAGGCWLSGLAAWALMGTVPGIILIGIGFIVVSWKLVKELQAEAKAESWRKNYPSYKY